MKEESKRIVKGLAICIGLMLLASACFYQIAAYFIRLLIH